MPQLDHENHARARRKRRNPATLAALAALCSSAPIVYLALVEEAREAGSHVVCTSRTRIAARTGLSRLNTISNALTALHRACWIERILVPRTRNGKRISLLRIVLRVDLSILLSNRKRRSTSAAVPVASRVHQEMLLDSLTERVCPAPVLTDGAGHTDRTDQTADAGPGDSPIILDQSTGLPTSIAFRLAMARGDRREMERLQMQSPSTQVDEQREVDPCLVPEVQA